MPRVGDLITEKVNNQKHVGIIYKVTFTGKVFINWSGKVPRGYYKSRGYSATNIHNQHHVYDLVRA
jgi:hypothetical protein